MKKFKFAAIFGIALLFAACKGNPSTTSGDSSGTGAGGARVPGMKTQDTTRHDSAEGKRDTSTLDTVKK
jgi:hypothetical protein